MLQFAHFRFSPKNGMFSDQTKLFFKHRIKNEITYLLIIFYLKKGKNACNELAILQNFADQKLIRV